MFISKKKLKEIIERLTKLENMVNSCDFTKTADPVDEISYKEVIDEWLNGKQI